MLETGVSDGVLVRERVQGEREREREREGGRRRGRERERQQERETDREIERPTCSARGFHLMFLSSAGVDVSVLCGRFFSVSFTPEGSPRSEFTRFFSCQPT